MEATTVELPAATQEWLCSFLSGTFQFSNLDQLRDERDDLIATIAALGRTQLYDEAIRRAYFAYKQLLTEA